MTLGQRLLYHRRRRGLTQHQLAQRAGVSQSFIARLEQGSSKDLASSIACRLALALGITTDYLLGMYTEEPADQQALLATTAAL